MRPNCGRVAAASGDFVTVFFVPIYFTFTGLRTSIGDWRLRGLGLVSRHRRGGCFAKWVGAYFAARGSSLGHAQSAMLGYMMNTRGLMELIVINVGLDLGVISPKVFTMLVIMAIVSTVITTPALRYYCASRPGRSSP